MMGCVLNKRIKSKICVGLGVLSSVLLLACSHNPHKAEVLETHMDQASTVSTDAQVGVDQEGNMVYKRKVLLAEELRRLENDVYETEDRVYGTRRYGTSGIYGKYTGCLRKVPPANQSTLAKVEKPQLWSDQDDSNRFGIDPGNNKLAAVTEEKLKDRIDKFRGYRKNLQNQKDLINENLKSCENLVNSPGGVNAH